MLCTGPVQEGYAVIFLETERLILRNLLPQDAETMFDYRNNEICARYQRGRIRKGLSSSLPGVAAICCPPMPPAWWLWR